MPTKAHSGRAVVTTPADTQILITREFDAPRRLVYKACTTPELVKRWWAGQRGTVTLVEIDLRVGGRWRHVMVAHEGFEVAFHGVYREIVPNERIVTTEAFEGLPDADERAALNTITFAEANGRTTMRVLVEMRSREDRDGLLATGMEGGMQESYDLLERVAGSLR